MYNIIAQCPRFRNTQKREFFRLYFGKTGKKNKPRGLFARFFVFSLQAPASLPPFFCSDVFFMPLFLLAAIYGIIVKSPLCIFFIE